MFGVLLLLPLITWVLLTEQLPGGYWTVALCVILVVEAIWEQRRDAP
jgi:hypothetical protein